MRIAQVGRERLFSDTVRWKCLLLTRSNQYRPRGHGYTSTALSGEMKAPRGEDCAWPRSGVRGIALIVLGCPYGRHRTGSRSRPSSQAKRE